jgi:uncharacterized oligopeptide transporter (OPT) family protein
MFFHIAIPFIHNYSIKIQFLILSLLLAGSYLHRGARRTIAFLASAYLAFKVIVPIIRLLFWLFKAISIFGFYVHYFQIGISFIAAGVVFVFDDGLKWLARELEKK